MKLAALLIVLLAFGTAHAAAAGYAFQYFAPENSSYYLAQFPHDNKAAQALIVNGSLYAIFIPKSTDSASLEPLSGNEKIASALFDYYSSSGYSNDSVKEFIKIHARVNSIRNSAKPGEDRCRILLGTDRHPCTDFESCQKACYSVTSFCQVVALGTGRTFINLAWAFENDSASLASAYGREQLAFKAFEANMSANTSAEYLASLHEISSATTRATSSQIYSDYSYCFLPDYNLSEVNSIYLSALQAYTNASRIYLIPFYTEKVRNTTLAGLARKAAFDAASASAIAPTNASSAPKVPSVPAIKETPAQPDNLPVTGAANAAAQEATPAASASLFGISLASPIFAPLGALLLLAALGLLFFFFISRKKKR